MSRKPYVISGSAANISAIGIITAKKFLRNGNLICKRATTASIRDENATNRNPKMVYMASTPAHTFHVDFRISHNFLYILKSANLARTVNGKTGHQAADFPKNFSPILLIAIDHRGRGWSTHLDLLRISCPSLSAHQNQRHAVRFPGAAQRRILLLPSSLAHDHC